MSALAGARAALVAQIQAAAPGLQVNPVSLAEDQDITESVSLGRGETRFDWRCLGPRRTNRSETITIDVRVDVWRHASRQQDSALAALDRADEILELIEFAVADGLDLNGTVTHARVSGWTVEPQPRNDGWAALGLAQVTADVFPTS